LEGPSSIDRQPSRRGGLARVTLHGIAAAALLVMIGLTFA
jgi:hypothetical protein